MKSRYLVFFFSIIVSLLSEAQNLKSKKFIDFSIGYESYYYIEKDSSLNVAGTKLTGNGEHTDNGEYHRLTNKKWKKVLSFPSEEYGFTVALDSKNNLWGWGNNPYGLLDDSLNKLVLKPKLLNEDNWVDFDISYDRIVALKNDNSLWIWGRTRPIQFFKPTKVFENVKSFSLGDGVTFVIKRDRSLWSLGSFFIWENGELNRYGTGNGNFESLDKPIQVGSDLDWSKISSKSHILAIKTNGKVYSWGRNDAGQLGIKGKEELHFYKKPTVSIEVTNYESIHVGNHYRKMLQSVKDVFAFYGESYIVDSKNNLYICRGSFGDLDSKPVYSVDSWPQYLGKNFNKLWSKIISENISKGAGLTISGDLYFWADSNFIIPYANRLKAEIGDSRLFFR